MNEKSEENTKLDLSEIQRKHDEYCEANFFDVQIHCKLIILPAHRYVLSSRSELLAEQLACGDNILNWTEFEDRTCATLLRWIYTNEVVFSATTDVTVAKHWLDLQYGSHKLQLASLSAICERALLSLTESTSRFYDLDGRVVRYQLWEKSVQLKLNSLADLTKERDVEIDEKSESSHMSEDEYRGMQLNKLTLGDDEFRQFSDIVVVADDNNWRAHAHVLQYRSKNFLKCCKEAVGYIRMRYIHEIEKILRWIYTDCVVLNDKLWDTECLMKAARFYELPTLFERLEHEIVAKVDITSCADVHRFGEKHNYVAISRYCNQLISKYYVRAKSPNCSKRNVILDKSNSLSGMLLNESQLNESQLNEWQLNESQLNESPTQESVDGLLTLNDDCLLHLFRSVSLVDLASIKDTCKRLSALADQSFRLWGDKSLQIRDGSMFADIWILKHFGKYIESLRLDSFYERYASHDNIFEMIARFTDERLKSIHLRDCGFTEGETFECLKTVLKNVICIELNYFDCDSKIDTLLSYCENLKEVIIDGEFMKLKSDWCLKNPNVTKVSLSGLLNAEILREICRKLTLVESLSVDYMETDTDELIPFSQLSSTLEQLKIVAYCFLIDQELQQFPNKTILRDLTLLHPIITESLASVLGEFPNLSILTFGFELYFDDNVPDILSKKLVNIESLTFDGCDNITFEFIANIVKRLLDLKKLTVKGCGKIEFIDKGQYLSLHQIKNLEIFVGPRVYNRTCVLIGNNWLSNVQVTPLDDLYD